MSAAAHALAHAPEGVARQAPYNELVDARRRCVAVIHRWLSAQLEPAPILQPHTVVIIGDGALFDEGDALKAVSLASAVAMRLLQQAGFALLLFSRTSEMDTAALCGAFNLLGGIAEYGARINPLSLEPASIRQRFDQYSTLRKALRADPSVVLDASPGQSVCASRVMDGRLRALTGPDARRLLESQHLTQLTFRVTPHCVDFVDRDVECAEVLLAVLDQPSLRSLPIVAIGAANSDIPALSVASKAFIPRTNLHGYQPPAHQRVIRCRSLADDVLWEAMWRLAPSSRLRQRAVEMFETAAPPKWFPPPLRRRPRLTDAVPAGYSDDWLATTTLLATTHTRRH
jgi:hypothetical protein